MATVTKSIGTSSRDYSTITAWQADLGDMFIYNSGDDAVGECYNDSVFDEQFTIDQTGLAFPGLNSIKLTAASGQEHNGTPGSGVKVKYTGTITSEDALWEVDYSKDIYGSYNVQVEKLEFAEVSESGSKNVWAWKCEDDTARLHRLLVNNIKHSNAGGVNLYIMQGRVEYTNCFIFNSGRTATSGSTNGRVRGFHLTTSTNNKVYNCTIHNIFDKDTTSADSWGVYRGVCKNTIITDADECMNTRQSSSDYNLSSDGTATGTNSLTNKTAANQYVSTTEGSEDLHLKAGADAIDAGTDLGTSPTNVNIDIDGRDRDSQGDVWDIGGDERVAAGGGTAMPAACHLYKQMMGR